MIFTKKVRDVKVFHFFLQKFYRLKNSFYICLIKQKIINIMKTLWDRLIEGGQEKILEKQKEYPNMTEACIKQLKKNSNWMDITISDAMFVVDAVLDGGLLQDIADCFEYDCFEYDSIRFES